VNSSLILVPGSEYLFLGCHTRISLVCNLHGKDLQGIRGDLLRVAGKDGNVYEGNPVKQFRTTKTTIIAIKFELIFLQTKIKDHFK